MTEVRRTPRELRARLVGTVAALLERPTMLAVGPSDLECAFHREFALLWWLEGRDGGPRSAIEFLERWGAWNERGVFGATAGSLGLVAEPLRAELVEGPMDLRSAVASVMGWVAAREGWFPLSRALSTAGLDDVRCGVAELIARGVATATDVARRLGPPSLRAVSDVATTWAYAGSGDEPWVFLDLCPRPERAPTPARSAEGGILRDARWVPEGAVGFVGRFSPLGVAARSALPRELRREP